MAGVRPGFGLFDAATAAYLLGLLPAGSIPLTSLAALTASRIVGSSASGVLQTNAALAAELLVYSTGTGSLANVAAITAARALISDVNGRPTHSSLTDAQLAAALFAKTDTATIAHTIASGSISSAVVAGSIGVTQLGVQQAANVVDGGVGGTLQALGTAYANYASVTYTPKSSSSRILVHGWFYHLYTSGTTTFSLRRGTTVISSVEMTIAAGGSFELNTVDVGHGGSSSTWNVSVKNSTPAGNSNYAQITVTDAR